MIALILSNTDCEDVHEAIDVTIKLHRSSFPLLATKNGDESNEDVDGVQLETDAVAQRVGGDHTGLGHLSLPDDRLRVVDEEEGEHS